MQRIAAAAVVVAALTTTAACGSDDSQGSPSGSNDRSASTPASGSALSSAPPEATLDADLAGPGCAAYARTVPAGDGSVAGMAADPVAVAVGNSPLLKSLTAAMSGTLNPKVNLVDALDSGEFTVFAPVDAAFARLPRATVKLLSSPTGASTLTTVLTFHVVSEQLTPAEIAGRTLKTVEGAELEIGGSLDRLKAEDANVVCGGIRTANATVYLVDSVLMPPSVG